MNGCPVLRELAVTEGYDREHEQAPVLSGGDYDISAIRSCGEDCLLGVYAWQRQKRIWGIAAILGLSSGDTPEIEDTIRKTLRSRDEWLEQATKSAARIEELTTEIEQMHKEATK